VSIVNIEDAVLGSDLIHLHGYALQVGRNQGETIPIKYTFDLNNFCIVVVR
jgi:hypothetical protein